MQNIMKITELSDSALEFYDDWTNDKNLLFINNISIKLSSYIKIKR